MFITDVNPYILAWPLIRMLYRILEEKHLEQHDLLGREVPKSTADEIFKVKTMNILKHTRYSIMEWWKLGIGSNRKV